MAYRRKSKRSTRRTSYAGRAKGRRSYSRARGSRRSSRGRSSQVVRLVVEQPSAPPVNAHGQLMAEKAIRKRRF